MKINMLQYVTICIYHKVGREHFEIIFQTTKRALKTLKIPPTTQILKFKGKRPNARPSFIIVQWGSELQTSE